MKKIYNSGKPQKFLKNKNFRKLRLERFKAGVSKSRASNKNYRYKQFFYEVRNRRTLFLKNFFRPRMRPEGIVTATLRKQIGLEVSLKEFLSLSKRIISIDSEEIEFNFDEVSRMWPSAITMLCSYIQWCELTKHPSQQVLISSTDPDETVNGYLLHSGFYNYVGRQKEVKCTTKFNDDHIVKIRRETKRNLINTRENEIIDLVQKYSSMTSDQIEIFINNVLIEVFNNVTEHGVSYVDSGWWTISQYHPTTGIISVCIADNGIGIKNTLLTGPQLKYVKSKLGSMPNDHNFIELAISNNVSGAVTATVISDSFVNKARGYKGSRRGQGLQIITEQCKAIGIDFSLISRKGYMFSTNSTIQYDSEDSDIFAGTLYHFKIPARNLNA